MKRYQPRKESIGAGIVSYEPDVELLLQNIDAISPQVERVFVFDNGSSNAESIAQAVSSRPTVILTRNPDNVGIASALNALVDLNSAAGLDWIVTLDQDSVPPAGMVSALAEYADEETPLLTPRIEDRRKKTSATDPRHANLPPVQYFTSAAQKGAITSGALLNVEALREVGGFDDQFFIDYVDYDLNMRLLTAGYKIARINGTHLSHQVGEAGRTWLVTPRRGIDGRWHLERFYSFGHSPTRCYYKARNRVLYTKKHWRRVGFSNEGVLQIPQQIALTVLFEDQRWAKLTAFARGIYDGMRTPVGKRIAP